MKSCICLVFCIGVMFYGAWMVYNAFQQPLSHITTMQMITGVLVFFVYFACSLEHVTKTQRKRNEQR